MLIRFPNVIKHSYIIFVTVTSQAHAQSSTSTTTTTRTTMTPATRPVAHNNHNTHNTHKISARPNKADATSPPSRSHDQTEYQSETINSVSDPDKIQATGPHHDTTLYYIGAIVTIAAILTIGAVVVACVCKGPCKSSEPAAPRTDMTYPQSQCSGQPPHGQQFVANHHTRDPCLPLVTAVCSNCQSNHSHCNRSRHIASDSGLPCDGKSSITQQSYNTKSSDNACLHHTTAL